MFVGLETGRLLVGTVAEGVLDLHPGLRGGLGLMRPNLGVIRDKSWCFLVVSRALLTAHGEGKQYIQVQNNNTGWKTQ